MKEDKKTIKIRKFKAGYELRYEIINGKPYGSKNFKMTSAYTPEGNYIGDSKAAWRLCVKRGIKPELAKSTDKVCSIGYSTKDGKWYGWSHRAIYGFKIGDKVKKGDCCASSGWTKEYLKEHPELDMSLPVGFKAKTMYDARRMAIAFADSVS
jgi:hypothetical protein